jgi:hypothetical protein
MTFKRRIIATAAIVATALTGAGVAATAVASPAPASSLPVVQTQGMGGGWHNGAWRVRPSTVYFGSMYGIYHIHWSSWTNHDGYGHGTMVAATFPGEIRESVSIHVYGVYYHSGPGKNFGYLKYTGSRFSQLLWIDSTGRWMHN